MSDLLGDELRVIAIKKELDGLERVAKKLVKAGDEDWKLVAGAAEMLGWYIGYYRDKLGLKDMYDEERRAMYLPGREA